MSVFYVRINLNLPMISNQSNMTPIASLPKVIIPPLTTSIIVPTPLHQQTTPSWIVLTAMFLSGILTFGARFSLFPDSILEDTPLITLFRRILMWCIFMSGCSFFCKIHTHSLGIIVFDIIYGFYFTGEIICKLIYLVLFAILGPVTMNFLKALIIPIYLPFEGLVGYIMYQTDAILYR